MENEQELLLLLRTGGEDAIKRIFNHYYIDLCTYADSILKDKYAAEEVVEELFITLWIKSKEIKILTSLESYLYRSVHNKSISYQKKIGTREKKYEKFFAEEISEFYSDESNHQIASLITKEIEDRANTILSELPEKCREIYELNRYENMSYPEIAEKLNITVGTVKTQMSRAFEKFRVGLKEFLTVFVVFLIS